MDGRIILKCDDKLLTELLVNKANSPTKRQQLRASGHGVIPIQNISFFMARKLWNM